LRHALWRIRAALKRAGLSNDPIYSDGIGVMFDPAADAWVDAREFERLCQSRPTSPEAMMTAATLYGGALLPGFYDDWATAQRDRLQLAHEALMSSLIAQLRADQRWLDILHWAASWAARQDGDDVSPHALAAIRMAMREVLLTGPETYAPAKPVCRVLKNTLKRLSMLLGEHALPQPRARPMTHDRRHVPSHDADRHNAIGQDIAMSARMFVSNA